MKVWSLEEAELLAVFIEVGMSYKEIGVELGRSWNSVRDKCRKSGR